VAALLSTHIASRITVLAIALLLPSFLAQRDDLLDW